MNRGIIYCATNTTNGKCYVGQTLRLFRLRKTEHYNAALNHKDNFYFHSALRKEPDKFEWTILEENIAPELLNEREQYWIQKKNSFVPNGYNLTLGGEGNKKILLDRNQVIELYSQYNNAKKVGEILGCNVHVILDLLHEENIATISGPQKIFEEDMDNISLLYEEGLSATIIADIYGLASSTQIWKKLKERGYSTRKGEKFDPLYLINDQNEHFLFRGNKAAALFLIEHNFTNATPKSVGEVIRQCKKGQRKTAYGFTVKSIDLVEYVQQICQELNIDCSNFIAKYEKKE